MAERRIALVPEVKRAAGEVWRQKYPFSHAQIVIRRIRTRIIGLFIDDNLCIDDKVLKREGVRFYKNLFCSQVVCHPSRLVLYSTLMAMDSFKAPGPYGVQVAFFKLH